MLTMGQGTHDLILVEIGITACTQELFKGSFIIALISILGTFNLGQGICCPSAFVLFASALVPFLQVSVQIKDI